MAVRLVLCCPQHGVRAQPLPRAIRLGVELQARRQPVRAVGQRAAKGGKPLALRFPRTERVFPRRVVSKRLVRSQVSATAISARLGSRFPAAGARSCARQGGTLAEPVARPRVALAEPVTRPAHRPPRTNCGNPWDRLALESGEKLVKRPIVPGSARWEPPWRGKEILARPVILRSEESGPKCRCRLDSSLRSE